MLLDALENRHILARSAQTVPKFGVQLQYRVLARQKKGLTEKRILPLSSVGIFQVLYLWAQELG